MAEAFGVVMGALSVAGVFRSCVECFDHIQLGKSFGRDYTTCQLRIDAVRLRLSRWGAAVKVQDNPRFTATVADDDQEAKLAISYFEMIQHRTQGLQISSKRYQLASTSQNLDLFSAEDMTPVGRRLHNRIAALVSHRQRNATTLQKTTWALYDGKEFESMISQIASLVDDVEKIFPVEITCRRLVEVEIEDVDDEPSLETLYQASDGTDVLLAKAVETKIGQINGKNHADTVQTQHKADVQIGHWYSEQVMQGGLTIFDRTTNSAGTVDAKGSSRVQIGSRFGSFAS
jgi:hypothetical protein